MSPRTARRRVALAVLLAAIASLATPLTRVNASTVPAVVAVQITSSSTLVQTYFASTADGDTVTPGTSVSAGGVRLSGGGVTADVSPASGQQFAAGQDYDASSVLGLGRPTVTLTAQAGPSFICVHVALHVQQADYDATGHLTAFIATFRSTCSTNDYGWGVIQYGAAEPFGFVSPTPARTIQLPDTLPGTSRTQTVTLVNRGTGPVQLGTPAMRGPVGAVAYAVTADSCATTSLAAGSSCTVDVTFSPQSLWYVRGRPRDASGHLRVRDDGGALRERRESARRARALRPRW